MLNVPPPASFQIGGLTTYYYSLTILVAVWTGYWMGLLQLRRLKLPTQLLQDSLIYVLLGLLVGGRLGFVAQNLTYFSSHPNLILITTTGGLSIHGAIVGASVALYWFSKQAKHSFWQLTDLYCLPLLIGQIIGRLGNYFNQELFGYPTNVPWAIPIDPSHRPADYSQFSHFHPVFAYEMLLLMAGFFILYRFNGNKAGQLTLWYLLIYSLARFTIEFWRISDRLVLGLSLAQLISLMIILLVIASRGRLVSPK